MSDSETESDTTSQTVSDVSSQTESPEEVEQVEASPEFDLAGIIHLSRLLTGDPSFIATDGASVGTLLDLAQQPSCDTSDDQLKENPYFQLVAAMTADPPTYTGEDPISDITMTIRQLASCQKSTTHSLLEKIGNFFARRDGGKALRQLLLLTKVVIECLALWYAMKESGMLDNPNSEDFGNLQQFCASAVDEHGIQNADMSLLPSILEQPVQTAEAWNRDMSAITSTFTLNQTSGPPILLIFNQEALQEVLQQIGNNGELPKQVVNGQSDAGYGGGDAVRAVTFIPQAQLVPFIQDYNKSGMLKPAQ